MIISRKNPKNAEITKRRRESEESLRLFSSLDRDAAIEKLNASVFGYSSEQAEELLEDVGENVISTGKTSGPLSRLFEALINPFNIVLFLVAIITFITDVVIAKKSDYTTVIVILALIFISSLISFIQSERSHSAAEKLSDMISNKTSILRDGVFSEIDIDQVVPGDIVRLSAGDMIPGDVLFISAKDAFISQSALTGESNPVEKFEQLKGASTRPLTDLENIGFMGSDMVSGSAVGLVVATGNNTYFGSMARSLSGARSKNSFELGVESVSRLLISFMLIMVPIIFLINGFLKGDWANALVFSVAIAVGLTPEMLPVIMTSTLARGAVNMSKRDTIVKSLPSIQTFGEMDILCTDKTGTLTEDKIILERYMDIHGDDDKRILRHAYLNSYFQTGLKNLIDVAIMNRAEQEGVSEIKERYHHVDEIPFDFARRRMSVVLEDTDGKRQLITKGAVEEILSICAYAEYHGDILPLDDTLRQEAMSVYEKHNFDGLRMIAVAQKNEIPEMHTFGVDDEADMVLMGFIGFLDPPKESAKLAIKALTEHGVKVVVLTGDSEGVAVKVCGKVGVSTEHRLNGADVEEMDDETLAEAIKNCHLFSKLSPIQKERVVKAYRSKGHTVGYMGDGINDTLAMRAADVGISVDSAVDIAKETADIILLKKDLMVLEEAVIEGRRTFGNVVKYIKMAASGNFGNMISMVFASIFLPFLPLLPVQILTQNLLCDFSQLGIPFDRVDESYIKQPRKWDTGGIRRFMLQMGPLSSFFDILFDGVLLLIKGANTPAQAALFQTCLFAFGTISQMFIVHVIRTEKRPFIDSKPSPILLVCTIAFTAITLFICMSPLAIGLDMAIMPLRFIPWLVLLLISYCLTLQGFKKIFIRRYDEWL